MSILPNPQLEELTKLAQRELNLGQQKPWVPETKYNGQDVKDVLIIGGGQLGCTLATRLAWQHGLTNYMVIDQRPSGKEGTWNDDNTRNITLRTPKHQPTPIGGLTFLSPEAYFTALYGQKEYDNTAFLPVKDFAQYLKWYRETTNISVHFNTQAGAIEAIQPDVLKVPLLSTVNHNTSHVYARHVVLATGFNSNNAPIIPEIIKTNLSSKSYAHTSQTIDFRKLSGKEVLVMGNGASAFDAAAVALEHGANVTLFFRKEAIPQDNPYRRMETYPYLNHMHKMSDEVKKNVAEFILNTGQAPPLATVERCMKHGSHRFKMVNNSSVTKAAKIDGNIHLQTSNNKTLTGDFLVVGTGYKIDARTKPELENFKDNIATWADMVDGVEDVHTIGKFPYLGPAFNYTPRPGIIVPGLDRIHDGSWSTFLKGLNGGSLSALSAFSYKLSLLIGERIAIDNADAMANKICTPGPDQLEPLYNC